MQKAHMVRARTGTGSPSHMRVEAGSAAAVIGRRATALFQPLTVQPSYWTM
jgi:hypothetical protein